MSPANSKSGRGDRFVSTPKSGRLKLDAKQRQKLKKDIDAGKAPAGAKKLLDADRGQQVLLVRARKARNVTQADVAEKLGVAQGRVSGIETRADVRVSTLCRYVKAIGGDVKIQAVFPNGEAIELTGD